MVFGFNLAHLNGDNDPMSTHRLCASGTYKPRSKSEGQLERPELWSHLRLNVLLSKHLHPKLYIDGHEYPTTAILIATFPTSFVIRRGAS